MELRIEHTSRGRAILYGDGQLIGWVTLTPADGRRAWSVTTLERWHDETPPTIRAASAEAAVDAWAAWAFRGYAAPDR